MRPKSEILAEVHEAVRGGRTEMHLLGQIVNHYQAPDDPQCDFAGLLAAVDSVPGIRRIRFASPHPRHVTPRLIEALRDLPHVCKHLHLPVQSGSTRVLAAMRRRHTREEYLELVRAVKTGVPGIQLSTDMIVGFPGETDEDFADTLSLVETVGFHSMFSFKYSERPGTLAAKRLADDVPEMEKDRRLGALQARAEGDSGTVARRGSRFDGRGAGGQRQPTPRHGAVGPDNREHGREFPWRRGVAGLPGDGRNRAGGRAQPVGAGALLDRASGWPYLVSGCRREPSARELAAPDRPGGGLEQTRSAMQNEMVIKGLMVDPVTNMPIVILRDKDGERVLPIWVGVFEANAIALQIENIATPRPMTHDLLRNVIRDLNGVVEKIVVSDLKETTFYALIYLRVGSEVVAIDARPSDALALALRTQAPIFVEEHVIDNAKTADLSPEPASADRLQKWLESLDPEELGKYKM